MRSILIYTLNMNTMNPDIQSHFEYCYDYDGALHIKVSPEFIKQIGWHQCQVEHELELSFGNIRKMNDWGDDVHLTIKRKNV
jgi:hypothetical protein